MVKKDKKISCVICDTEVNEKTDFSFNMVTDVYFFCKNHALPFKMGLSLGQIEIDSKFLSFIDNPELKEQVAESMFALAPLSKIIDIPDFESQKIEFSVSTPKEIYDKLSEVVIGQELAKKHLSVAGIRHINAIKNEMDVKDKHHVLLLGKSGSGKTLLTSTLADILSLPYVIADATSYSPTGYHGADADSVTYDLLINANMNPDIAEQGIVVFDEIDKIITQGRIAGKNESFISSTQSTLLKLVEGKMVNISGVSLGDPTLNFVFDTSRLLFILSGAFNGLAEIVAKKMGQQERSLGFNKKYNESQNKEIDTAIRNYEIYSQAGREELIDSLVEYGMLAELAGRIPTIAPLKPLAKEELFKVLTESNASPMKKQMTVFEKNGYELIFTDECINKIIDISYQSATGTRALDSYVKKSLSAASYNFLTTKMLDKIIGQIVIDTECIEYPDRYKFESK